MPFNYRGVHWVCLKIDMVDRVAYLFDSLASATLDTNKLNAAKMLVCRAEFHKSTSTLSHPSHKLTVSFCNRFKQCMPYCNYSLEMNML
ncbi:unnamed protein product [Camellia sinensis]